MSTRGFPRIFGYHLQAIKYSISVPLDRGGFGGWNADPVNQSFAKIHGKKPLVKNKKIYPRRIVLNLFLHLFLFSCKT